MSSRNKRNKKPKIKAKPGEGKRPRSSQGSQAESFDTQSPTWSFVIADKRGPESLYSDRAGSDRSGIILPKLRDFEGLTWAEIKRQTHGHGKSSNHHVPVNKMLNKVGKRLAELNLDETGQLFSLRLDSRKRIYGIKIGSVLRVIWYDPDHRLYPTKAK